MPIKPSKKLLPLDKLYKIYKANANETPNATQRINWLYSEGGYKDKVGKLLANPTYDNAVRARTELQQFRRDVYPLEIESYFETHPKADRIKDFDKAYKEAETRIGPIINDAEKDKAERDRLAEEWKARFDNGYITSDGKKLSENEAKKLNKNQMKIFEEVFSAPAGKRDLDKLKDFKFIFSEDLLGK